MGKKTERKLKKYIRKKIFHTRNVQQRIVIEGKSFMYFPFYSFFPFKLFPYDYPYPLLRENSLICQGLILIVFNVIPIFVRSMKFVLVHAKVNLLRFEIYVRKSFSDNGISGSSFFGLNKNVNKSKTYCIRKLQ